MKTLGRILIILAVFAVVMGIAYMIVNAGNASTSANMPAFERGGEGRPRPEDGQSQFDNDERPEFPGERPESGERPEFGREGRRGGSWMFGWIKNIGIIAIIVVPIALIKSFARKKSAPAPAE